MSKLYVKVLSRFLNPMKLVTLALKAAGDGALGPRVLQAYNWMAGKKSFIVAGLTAFGAFLVQLRAEDPAACASIGCDSLEVLLQKWGPVVATYLGGMVVSALDDAVRAEPPNNGGA